MIESIEPICIKHGGKNGCKHLNLNLFNNYSYGWILPVADNLSVLLSHLMSNMLSDDDDDDGDYNVVKPGLGHMCPNPQNGLFQCF